MTKHDRAAEALRARFRRAEDALGAAGYLTLDEPQPSWASPRTPPRSA